MPSFVKDVLRKMLGKLKRLCRAGDQLVQKRDPSHTSGHGIPVGRGCFSRARGAGKRF